MDGEKELLERMQETLDHAVEVQEIAGANVMLAHHGKEVGYLEAGWADVEQKEPIRRDTIFRIYSMTKPITGAAVMLLLERGQIDLAEPVSKYLPGFRGQRVEEGDKLVPVVRDVTIHHLLSMTSGLIYPDEQSCGCAAKQTTAVFRDVEEQLFGTSPRSTQDIANALGQCPLQFQPGTSWKYGASADVLGAVVEQVTGMKYGEFLKKNFFTPLEMKDTGFYVPVEKQSRLAKVYEPSGNGLVLYEGNRLGIRRDMAQPPAFESGGAGLASTIDDYAKFAQMLMKLGEYNGRRVMRKETVRYFTSCCLSEQQQAGLDWDALAGYSYGNLMRVLTKPHQALVISTKGEYGWDGWLGTYFANDPRRELTFLMMTQRTNGGSLSVVRKTRNCVYAALDALENNGQIGF